MNLNVSMRIQDLCKYTCSPCKSAHAIVLIYIPTERLPQLHNSTAASSPHAPDTTRAVSPHRVPHCSCAACSSARLHWLAPPSLHTPSSESRHCALLRVSGSSESCAGARSGPRFAGAEAESEPAGCLLCLLAAVAARL